MLISHSKKFIFIHVYKVAGTSIREALSPYCYPGTYEKIRNGLLKRHPVQSSSFPHHIRAAELKSKISSNIFDPYFKFGFVRNPWDWQVSLYHFTQQNPEHFQHDLVKKMTFEDYIKWRVEEAKCSQKEFLYDRSGNQLVDFVGKIENINEHFQTICDKIGVKNRLKHTNMSIHQDYRKMYSDKTAQLIADAYRDEITLFNYRFDRVLFSDI